MTAAADLAEKFLKAANSRDMDLLAGCYAEDATQVHPFFPAPNVGRDAILAAESPMFTAFSDIDWRLVRVIEQGDWAAIETVVSATNTAELPTPGGPVPATGRRVTLALVNVVRLNRDGVIAEETRYYDVAGMMRQLGLA